MWGIYNIINDISKLPMGFEPTFYFINELAELQVANHLALQDFMTFFFRGQIMHKLR